MRMFKRRLLFGSSSASDELANVVGAKCDFEWKRTEEYIASSSILGSHSARWQRNWDSNPFDYELQCRAYLLMSALKS